jgi:hypothetical protein
MGREAPIFRCLKMNLSDPRIISALKKTMESNVLPLKLLVLASLIVFALFIWQGNKGFSLTDEGYLWYGAQRVLLGEMPMRDFMAYDPGRYYWSAAIMSLLNDNGVMALRGASALFETIGIFIGLLLIVRTENKQNFLYLILSAIILVTWMIMSFKAVDYVIPIFLIGALTLLAQNPINRNFFFVGLFVGLAALFGRNHGVYGVVGSIGFMLWLNFKRPESHSKIKEFFLWTMGVTTGYMPMICMMLIVPGFAEAFWESIIFQLEIGASSLPLPVPWPWLINYASIPLSETIRDVLVGVFFIAIIVFGVLSVAWVFWQKLQDKKIPPVLVAASFLALPYAHYAYSRADIYHLSFGIFPLLIGYLTVLAEQSAKIRWSLAFMLWVASIWTTLTTYPGWQCYLSKKCVEIEISSNKLVVDLGTANDVGLLRKLVSKYAPDNQNFIATPLWPGAYALLGRKSPMWEIYAFFRHTPSFEQAEIERIKTAKPGFVFVFDLPLDWRDELRFKNTHPLIYQFILDNFEPLSDSPIPAYQIFKAK